MRQIFAAFGLLMALTVGAFANDADMMKMQDQMFDTAVQIVVGSATPMIMPGGFCSGQIVYSNREPKSGKVNTLVLTAKHCTDAKDERMDVIVDTYDKTNHRKVSQHYPAKVWGQSYKSDLAILKLDNTEDLFEKVATIAEKDIVLQFGDTVELVGYPMGLSKTWTEGKLGYIEDMHGLAFDDISQSGQFYRATPMMTGGSSGSSMFLLDSDGDYKIIGVLTGGAGGFIGLYTPIDEIRDYVDTALKVFDATPVTETHP